MGRIIDKIQGAGAEIKTEWEFFNYKHPSFLSNIITFMTFSALGLLLLAYMTILFVLSPAMQYALILTSWDYLPWITIVSSMWFFYRKMNARAILALMAFFLGIYINSFPLASMPSQEPMHSSMYIEKSRGMYFYDLHGYLTFGRDWAVMRHDIMFGSGELPDGNVSYYRLTPPSSAIRYFINITGETRDGKTVTLLYKENDSITNKSFPGLEGKFVLNELTQYRGTLSYTLSPIKPHIGVAFRLGGYNNAPSFNNVYYMIQFDELYYECMTPCVVPVTQGLRVDAPAIRTGESRLLPKRIESYIQYDIRGNNTSEVWFIIRTTSRIQLILRGLSLTIIAGLIVALARELLGD